MRRKNRMALLILLSWIVQPLAAGDPPWQKPGDWPDRIIATLTENPAESFSVSWRTSTTVDSAEAEIVEARAAARFDVDARTVTAQTVRFELDPGFAGTHSLSGDSLPLSGPVNFHSVRFEGLEPDRLYAYRVRGAEDQWSPWQQIRTAPADGPVEFLYFGDSQNGIRSHVSRVFEAAVLDAPAARFMVHAGDLVNKGTNDRYWAEWFEAGGDLFRRVPSAPAAGNHDYYTLNPEEGYDSRSVRVTPLWRPHFRLPVEASLPPELHETVYDIRYTPDIHLFALDSTGNAFDQQMAWLERKYVESDATWRIVYMHHPYFSWVGEGEEKAWQTERRVLFDAFLERRDVDLVLTGHRHSYQRSESGPQVHFAEKRKPYAVDTVFLVTAMTIKRGVTKVEGWERFAQERKGNFTLTRWGDYVPIFGVFRVDGNTLSYRAVDAVGDHYDAFVLKKDGKGRKTLINGDEAFGPVWTTENAGPYRDWRE